MSNTPKNGNLSSIDPKRYAEAGRTLEGALPLSSLSLPAEVLVVPQAVVHYQFSFGVDKEDYVYIHGQVKTELNLECQRCLKPMSQSISSEFYLSPVRTGVEAHDLPERYEAIFLEEGKVSLSQIVEEELILSLPMAPMHTGNCRQEFFH